MRRTLALKTSFQLSAGLVSYVTENEVAGVGAYLFLRKVLSGIGVFSLRPDLWVLMVHRSLPIGVVDVKKPDLKTQAISAREHPNVLGELSDIMQHLLNFMAFSRRLVS